MGQPTQPEFTAGEFIAWALEQPTGRFELGNGTVVAMAPEPASHNQAKLNGAIALRGAIVARGLPCRVMMDGMAVRIDDRTVYEPDALVRCGPPLPGDVPSVRHYLIVDTDRRVVIHTAAPTTAGSRSRSLPAVR